MCFIRADLGSVVVNSLVYKFIKSRKTQNLANNTPITDLTSYLTDCEPIQLRRQQSRRRPRVLFTNEQVSPY